MQNPKNFFLTKLLPPCGLAMGGDLAPSLGERKKIWRTKFSNDLFRKNFRFDPGNSDDLFLVIDHILSVFCLSLLS